MSAEKWRRIPALPGYEVSDQGRIRSLLRATPVIRAQQLGQWGYPQVTFRGNGLQVTKPVHRLVAEAFLGPLPEGQQTRHLNGNKQDNRVVNLAYGTASENQLDEVRLGRHKEAVKTQCAAGHPYSDENTYVWHNHRKCRTCHRGLEAARRARRADA